jgi:hypothetical protein
MGSGRSYPRGTKEQKSRLRSFEGKREADSNKRGESGERDLLPLRQGYRGDGEHKQTQCCCVVFSPPTEAGDISISI